MGSHPALPEEGVISRSAGFEKQLGGRYRFGRLLGRGGMGEVWAAHDTRFERAVAIKILGAELSGDAEFVERFHREYKTLAKASHSRIVSIYDAGAFPSDARLYMIMELFRGKTLRALLDENRDRGTVFDPVTASFYAFQVLDGLGGVHDQGIIHRDVKPENIIVDAQGHLKLVDFGVAKAMERTGPRREPERAPPAGKPFRTKESMLLGTPRYMAPELIEGLPIDHRVDLYAVGVMLVRMLTGKGPYDVDEDDELAVLRAHVEQEPILHRDRNPDCPELVWSVALTLLEKDPDARFPTADDAIEALWPFLRHSALPEHPHAKAIHAEHREVAHRRAFESLCPPPEPSPPGREEAGEAPEEGEPQRRTVEMPASGFVAPSPCSPSAVAALADTTRPIGAVPATVGPYPLARPLADVTKPIPVGALPPIMRAPYPLARPALAGTTEAEEPARRRWRTPIERQRDRQFMLYGAVLALGAVLVAVVVTLVLMLRVPPPVAASSAGAATAQRSSTVAATAEPPGTATAAAVTAEPTAQAAPAPTAEPSATAPVTRPAPSAVATAARRPAAPPKRPKPPEPVILEDEGHVLAQPRKPGAGRLF
jgi:serine/threonine protein kinase